MLKLSVEELAELKGKGFLFMKDKQNFACRVLYPIGIATPEQLRNTAYLAEKYASGKVIMTVRLNAEIFDVPYENIKPMMEEMDRMGISYGGTGAKVRPIVACKGTYCKFGLVDTQKIGLDLHDQFFEMPLPHKFKISVTGCPNNCGKVQLNDLGFMGGAKNTLRLFIGGRFGRKALMGEEICTISADQACEATSICADFYKAHGKAKQRFGDMLVGMKDTSEYLAFVEQLKALSV